MSKKDMEPIIPFELYELIMATVRRPSLAEGLIKIIHEQEEMDRFVKEVVVFD